MTRTMTTIAVSRQQSARNGSLRASWCRKPARTGKCQRIGRAELNQRGGSPEVVRILGEERRGPVLSAEGKLDCAPK